MNCISLHQYWAALMQVGVKKIETRNWQPAYRGPLAIHAAGMLHGYVRDAYNENESVQSVLRDHFGVKNFYELRRKLTFSAIVCVVELVEVVEAPGLPGLLEQVVPDRFKTDNWLAFGNFDAGRSLWLCDNVRALREPVKLKARQTMFPLTQNIVDEVNKRI